VGLPRCSRALGRGAGKPFGFPLLFGVWTCPGGLIMSYKLSVFGVYDEKAKAFLPPWFMPNVGMAMRVFGDCVNDANHQFGKHPSDYSLFCFGQFDPSSGKFELPAAYELVANGVMCKQPDGSFVDRGNGACHGVLVDKGVVHENA